MHLPNPRVLLFPYSTLELTKFYLFWITAYCFINIIWDIRTKRTPAFHITMLRNKYDVLYNAATFASSLILLAGLLDHQTGKLAGDAILPIILAAFSGFLVTVASLCPYSNDEKTA